MGLKMKYFVLKPRGTDVYAAASRHAMSYYASYLKDHGGDAELARELSEWSVKELVAAERGKASAKDIRDALGITEETTERARQHVASVLARRAE